MSCAEGVLQRAAPRLAAAAPADPRPEAEGEPDGQPEFESTKPHPLLAAFRMLPSPRPLLLPLASSRPHLAGSRPHRRTWQARGRTWQARGRTWQAPKRPLRAHPRTLSSPKLSPAPVSSRPPSRGQVPRQAALSAPCRQHALPGQLSGSCSAPRAAARRPPGTPRKRHARRGLPSAGAWHRQARRARRTGMPPCGSTRRGAPSRRCRNCPSLPLL